MVAKDDNVDCGFFSAIQIELGDYWSLTIDSLHQAAECSRCGRLEIVKYRIADPAGLDAGKIHGIAGVHSVAEAVSRFDRAHNSVFRAEELASLGRVSDAVTEWRKLFGKYFPAYG